jgi:hypothetical protein
MSCNGFEIFLVEKLDLYEWNCGQEPYKTQSSESKWGHVCPANVPNWNRLEGKYVLLQFVLGKKRIF